MARKTNAFQNVALISQIGISMVVPIIMGLYIGNWLDNRLETGPLFLFIFIIIGVGSGFMGVFRLTQREFGQKKRK